MSAGERPPRRQVLRAGAASVGLLALLSAPAQAIDNPDAPDHSAEFRARARPHEDRLAEATGGAAAARAGAAYAEFLDAELNQAYRALMDRLDADGRRALARAQRQWLAFRDAELRFIDAQFTPQRFGSSSALSRADHRASLVRQRVLGLLAYLQNYASDRR